jgi:two-component system, chemotaxis family, protein-glutamate methylesterase/glutaminase
MTTHLAKIDALVIGGSAGSLKVVKTFLQGLSKPSPIPIILGLHRLQNDPSSGLREVVQFSTPMPVVEPSAGETIRPGTVYLAPANRHLIVEPDFTFSLSDSPLVQYSRPSIDVLFLSVADAYKQNLAALLVTGANRDGAFGTKTVKENGGYVMIQEPADSFVDTMPKAALAMTTVDKILLSSEMSAYIEALWA